MTVRTSLEWLKKRSNQGAKLTENRDLWRMKTLSWIWIQSNQCNIQCEQYYQGIMRIMTIAIV